MTDHSQTIANKYAYDSFGNITAETETVTQPFKYMGRYGVITEIYTGNTYCYMKARYYDPKIGWFISEDPIAFDGGDVNLYAYVGNNPVMKVDPTGSWNSQVHDSSQSGTQFVDDNPATSPLYPFAWGLHFGSRETALQGMNNAQSKTEYLTWLHLWEDSFNPAHSSVSAHLLAWVDYGWHVLIGDENAQYYNPDNPNGKYHWENFAMENARQYLTGYNGERKGGVCGPKPI